MKKRNLCILGLVGALTLTNVFGTVSAFAGETLGDAAKEQMEVEEAEEEAEKTVEEAVEEDEESVIEDSDEAAEEEELGDRPEYEISDYVKELGEYKGVTVTKETPDVTDEEVDAQIQTNIESAGLQDKITEGTVQENDIANIDYTGYLDGEEFDGGSAEGYDLTIGSGSFIEGFEEGLIGAAIGDTVDLNLTFPEDYSSEDLAGQDVVFTVTINYVTRTPDLTDELAEKLSDGEYTTADDYKASVKADLEASEQEDIDYDAFLSILDSVIDSSTIDGLPEDVIDYELAKYEKNYSTQLQSYYGFDLETYLSYLGYTLEGFEADVRSSIESNIKYELAAKAIAQAEGMEVTDEEVDEACQTYADEYNYESLDAFLEYNTKDDVRNQLIYSKVQDFLLENAQFVEADESEETTEEETAEEETTEETTEE